MRTKIRIDTYAQAKKFAEIAERAEGRVVITDGNGLCVNGKSIMGALHAMEFDELWCESEANLTRELSGFAV